MLSSKKPNRDLCAIDPKVIRGALDAARGSVRREDANGYLHVAWSNVTRVQVAPYFGKEIPEYEKLGLDPEKIYYGYRSAEELEKATPTLNAIPLLIDHKFDSASDPNIELRCGTMGEQSKFVAPFLGNSLTLWTQEAINAVESGEKRDLSAGYEFVADFTPGKTPEGENYDFLMRDIKFNHVALVINGRASNCYVEESLPKGLENMNETEKQGACDDFAGAVRNALIQIFGQLPDDKLAAAVAKLSELKAAPEGAPAAPAAPAAKDAAPNDAPAAPAGAKDEDKPAESAPAAKPEGAADEDKPAEEKPEDKPKGAMDANAIAQIAIDRIKAQYAAAEAVRPVVGAVNAVAYDSADDIYLQALKTMGVKTPVSKESARAVFEAIQNLKAGAVVDSPKGALDADTTGATETDSVVEKWLDKIG